MMPFANLIVHGDVAACSLNEIRAFYYNAGLNVEKLIRTHTVALGSYIRSTCRHNESGTQINSTGDERMNTIEIRDL